MNNLQDELDALFGFTSTWTAVCGDGCWAHKGEINIDDVEIDDILADMDSNTDVRPLILRFLSGHEKGHHLQEIVWPDRCYDNESHLMEIEADLIGAWVLALHNLTISSHPMIEIVKQFDDADRIAQRLGTALGDSRGNNPHHPWAEQRHLALARGPQIALLYPNPLTDETRGTFAHDVRKVARRICFGKK